MIREPVIYSSDVFPRDVVHGEFSRERFAGSFLGSVEGDGGIRIVYSRAVLSAVSLETDRAEQIGLSQSDAWVLLEQTAYDAQDQLISSAPRSTIVGSLSTSRCADLVLGNERFHLAADDYLWCQA